ncbi:MAG: hypothetical protein GX573_27510 [Chloroflexi bacterium]|nr:hypothetical protein [Chloroflexota bacterium]
MCPKRNRRPRWYVLDLIMLLAVGALVLEHSLNVTPIGHKVILSVIVVAVYGLMGSWVKANTATLDALDAEKCREQSRDPAIFGTQEFPTHTQARFR